MKYLTDLVDFIINQEATMSESVTYGMKLMLLQAHGELEARNISTVGELEVFIEERRNKIKANKL